MLSGPFHFQSEYTLRLATRIACGRFILGATGRLLQWLAMRSSAAAQARPANCLKLACDAETEKASCTNGSRLPQDLKIQDSGNGVAESRVSSFLPAVDVCGAAESQRTWTLRIPADRHIDHAGVANQFRTDFDRRSWSPDARYLNTFPVRKLLRPVSCQCVFAAVINVSTLYMRQLCLTEVTRTLAGGSPWVGAVSS